ncbi:MAG: WbqC family protein [Desulfobulbaceae bacterium]|nr:WbqC family protein [Desulfobulbaceae bacterium]
MIISAHQPAYMPWPGYLHRIAICDRFVILDEVQFEKNSFTNRNRIKGPGGTSWLTVPVCLKGHLASTIRQVKIVKDNKWAKKQWKSLQQFYAKAPFFAAHADFFHEVLEGDWSYISPLNRIILNYLLEQFSIETPLVDQSKLRGDGRKQDLILSLCDELGADSFIFGKLGKDYVDSEKFRAAGVAPCFHEYNTFPYPQLWDDFEPNLSAIDLLFNVPPDELKDRLFSGGMLYEIGSSS